MKLYEEYIFLYTSYNVKLGTWNVISLYGAGSLVIVSKQLSKYKLDLVGVQVRLKGGGTEQAGECTFFYLKVNENHELRFFFIFSLSLSLSLFCA
jgi:hypothetical protein